MNKFLLLQKSGNNKSTGILSLMIMLFFSFGAFAQLSITSVSPTVVTDKSVVTIIGTGFTANSIVRFNGISATDKTFISSTQIEATAPIFTTGPITVKEGTPVVSSGTVTFVAGNTAPAIAGSNRIITDFGGYFSSTATSGVGANQPDTRHNVLGFGYGSSVYTTGVNNALVLSNVPTAITAAFRALPLATVGGKTAPSPAIVFLAMADKIDGIAGSSDYTASAISSQTLKSVLNDGIRGLDIGTGLANIGTDAVIKFSLLSITLAAVTDNDPDILISQIADPSTTNKYDSYVFFDSNGNIVGTPVKGTFNSFSAIATYKLDLFTLQQNTLYETAVPFTNGSAGTDRTRPIRLMALKLSDFGINASNYAQIVGFSVLPVGEADPAFFAYNEGSMQVAPVITKQPISQNVCPGLGLPVTFSVGTTGDIFQWKKDGVNISGATSSSYTIASVTAADAGEYTVVVSNSGASVTSNVAFLNVKITSDPVASSNVCTGAPNTLTVAAIGKTLTYKWFSNTTNSNVGGTVISGATAASYATPTAVAGTFYYYAEVTSAAVTCTTVKTTVSTVVVSQSVGGTVSPNQSVCLNTSAGDITLTGNVGNVTSWQRSATANFAAPTTIANTTTTLTSAEIGVITATTYFRAVVQSGVCAVAYSTVATVGPVTTTWNGTSWDNGTPTSTTAAVFSGNYTASTDLDACSILVNNSAVVMVNSGIRVSIYGTITVASGSFTLDNANLLQGTNVTNSGNIVVKRTTSPVKRLDYVLWSSPVVNQNLLAFSPGTLIDRFYTYDPASDLYVVVGSPSTTTMAAATGYLVRTPNAFNATTPTPMTRSFIGEPRNGNVTSTVSSGAYNAIGNPYPSAISADSFMTANQITAPLYFWRKVNNTTTSSYATYTFAGGTGTMANASDPSSLTPNGFIQSGQGFITIPTSGTIMFDNTMRSNASGPFFRTSELERNRIWINLTNIDGLFSQTMVSYMTGGTSVIDQNLDGPYINDSQNALTSVIEGGEFAIQARALPFVATDVVPLGFKVEIPGSYSISLDSFDGLFTDANQAIYIKDNVANAEQNLRNGSYTFSTEGGVENNRFEIVYATTLATNNQSITPNSVVVYKQNSQIMINSGKANMKTVQVYDVRGRLIAEKNNVNSNETSISAGTTNQVLIVKVTSDNNVTVSKKVVN